MVQAAIMGQKEEKSSFSQHPNPSFEKDEVEEEFAKELAAQADRITPTVKYYLTGKKKRKAGEKEEKEEESDYRIKTRNRRSPCQGSGRGTPSSGRRSS